MGASVDVKIPRCPWSNGKFLDISNAVLSGTMQYRQNSPMSPEAGGLLIGYQNCITHNTSITELTVPFPGDRRNRVLFIRKDKGHLRAVERASKEECYYMGTWHTHPQNIPSPSPQDRADWKLSLQKEQTGCEYIFFLIIGITHFCVWCGDFQRQTIVSLHECKKDDIGIYLY